MLRGEILIGQLVRVARVKDVCVIESTRARINCPGRYYRGDRGGQAHKYHGNVVSLGAWLESYFTR
jgi:hypothetical protein